MLSKRHNLWLGLESYQENQIIYGRNEEICDLSQRVLNDIDTVVYGKSGIGKTSIINAGILPVVRKNGIIPIVLRLDHSNNQSYIKQIKEAVGREVEIVETISAKNIDKELFWEFFHRHQFFVNGKRVKLMLIFDQFEEIFTLQQTAVIRTEFFKEFADVLNDAMPKELAFNSDGLDTGEDSLPEIQVEGFACMSGIFNNINSAVSCPETQYVNDNNIHFIFILREDFLSEFEFFTTKIPSLKLHRFALRPLNEEQAAEIITQPCPGLVSMDVAHFIIETVTGRSDFSLGDEPEIDVDAAVLSLFLSRIYQKLSDNDDVISSHIIKQFGADIIKDFYIESIENLTDVETNLMEDKLLTSSGRRNNVSYSDFCKFIDKNKIDNLILEKKLLRTFNYGNDIRIEFIHDILCPVVKERKEQREQLRLQEEERKRQEEEKIKFQEQEKHKRQVLLEKTKRERIRNHRRNVILCSIIAILLVVGCVCYFWKFHVYSDYYARYEIKNGKIIGVESTKLSNAECKRTPLFYCLKHRGLFTHISEIDVKSSNKMLPANPRVNVLGIGESNISNDKGVLFNDLLSSVCKIRISEDENKRTIKEEYVDNKNNVLFELNYSYINGRDAWVHFVSAEGQGLVVRDSGVEQVRLSWDENGNLVGITYYDHKGVCKEIDKGINGYLWDYLEDGTICRYTLNEYAQPTISSDYEYNIVYTKETNDSTVTRYARSTCIRSSDMDDNEIPANGPLGFAKILKTPHKELLYDKSMSNPVAELKEKCDDRGNVLYQKIEGQTSKDYPSSYKYEYDKNGYLVSKIFFNSHGQPFGKTPEAIYKWKWRYDDTGKLVHEERVMAMGKVAYSKTLKQKKNCLIEETEDISKVISYVKKVETVDGKRQVVSYYGRNNKKLNGKWRKNSTETDSLLVFHRMVKAINKNEIAEAYYCFDEKTNTVRPLLTHNNSNVYYKKVTILDHDGLTSKYRTYDDHGNILKSMMYLVQNGKIIGRAVWGIDDKPIRCNKWEAEGYSYYKIYINSNNDNDYTNIMAVNEWGEKSVLFDGNEYWNTEYLNCRGLSFIYKNVKYKISGTYSQMNFVTPKDLSTYSIPYLHILDKRSPLYQVGLRDGDRIIACGEWQFGMNSELLNKCWNNKKQKISIKLLRVCGNKYEIIKKEIPSIGLHMYAEFHELRLTQNEYLLLKTYLQ